MGFNGKKLPVFDPVPKMVRGIVIDHCGKTCSNVYHEIMEAIKEGFVRICVKHKDGSLEVFDTGK